MFPTNPTTSKPNTPSQSQKAASARALLHALLLAGMDPSPNPNQITPSSPSPLPATPRPTHTTTTTPSTPSTAKLITNPLTTTTANNPTHRQQPHRQTLTIDTATRITGHGNAVTVPPQLAISPELVLAALQKGCNVEIRTGVTVFGCKNAVAAAVTGAPVVEVGGKRKRGEEEEGGKGVGKGMEGGVGVKREKVFE